MVTAGYGEGVIHTAYRVRGRFADGREFETDFSTPRPGGYKAGDLVVLPQRQDGRCESGKGHIWHIVAEEAPNILVIEYVRRIPQA